MRGDLERRLAFCPTLLFSLEKTFKETKGKSLFASLVHHEKLLTAVEVATT